MTNTIVQNINSKYTTTDTKGLGGLRPPPKTPVSFRVILIKKYCKDCGELWCKTYYLKTNIVKGYCHLLHKNVNGNDLCQYHPPTRQLDLFDDDPI